jgi:hypothetical protein
VADDGALLVTMAASSGATTHVYRSMDCGHSWSQTI